MFLKNAIPISLAVTAILSIFMLQMGSDEETSKLLAVSALFLIPLGVWLVDLKRFFSLPEWLINLIILGIILIHLGKIFQSPSEFLAYSIANILAYVQIVLFYRRKEVLVDYHILILSFIQGGVACVFQQNPIFAPLLLAYSFALLCSLSLLFLNQERYYYRNHAFLKSAFDRGEKVKRVTIGHLLVLAVKTIFITPLVVIWGYRWKEWSADSEEDGKEVIVHRAPRKKEKTPLLAKEEAKEEEEPIFFAPKRRSRFFSFSRHSSPSPELSPSPDRHGTGTSTTLRWPLARSTPLFSGASRSGKEPVVDRKLFFRLFTGAFFSLTAAGVIFLLFPRYQNMEVGGFQIGHDRWQSAPEPVRSVVGFSENIRLGEIGPSSSNFESVMRIRLLDAFDEERPAVPPETPIWLRGTVLAHYEAGEWSIPKRKPGENIRLWERGSFRRNDKERDRHSPSDPLGSFFPKKTYQIPGYVVMKETEISERMIFDDRNELVREEIHLYPLSTPILFSVWPFFQFRFGHGILDGERFLRPQQEAERPMALTLFTNAFRDGEQVDLIPVGNPMDDSTRKDYLQFDADRLAGLAALARRWDQESGLTEADVIARVRNLEDRLRNSGDFHYSRLGVPRDSRLDPLEDFVMRHPEGHCEYFAGALAMMIRALGIPSRVVVGFCFTTQGEETTVRQSDAHSWTEAFIPADALPDNPSAKADWWKNGGWLRLDATPEATPELFQNVSRSYHCWREAFRGIWNHYILNYDDYYQRENVYHPILVAVTESWRHVVHWVDRLNPFTGEWSFSDNDLSSEVGGAKGKMNVWRILSTLFLFLFFLLLMVKIVLYRRQRVASRSPARKITSEHFGRLEALLTRIFAPRGIGETPREYIGRFLASPESDRFCQTLADAESPFPSGKAKTKNERDDGPSLDPTPIRDWLDANLRFFVEIYYRVRFGETDLPATDHDRFRQFFERIRVLSEKKRPAKKSPI